MADDTLDGKMKELLAGYVQALLDLITPYEDPEMPGLMKVRASAQDMANIRQFLKDNGYSIDPIKGKDALDDLIAGLDTKPTIPEVTQ